MCAADFSWVLHSVCPAFRRYTCVNHIRQGNLHKAATQPSAIRPFFKDAHEAKNADTMRHHLEVARARLLQTGAFHSVELHLNTVPSEAGGQQEVDAMLAVKEARYGLNAGATMNLSGQTEGVRVSTSSRV